MLRGSGVYRFASTFIALRRFIDVSSMMRSDLRDTLCVELLPEFLSTIVFFPTEPAERLMLARKLFEPLV